MVSCLSKAIYLFINSFINLYIIIIIIIIIIIFIYLFCFFPTSDVRIKRFKIDLGDDPQLL